MYHTESNIIKVIPALYKKISIVKMITIELNVNSSWYRFKDIPTVDVWCVHRRQFIIQNRQYNTTPQTTTTKNTPEMIENLGHVWLILYAHVWMNECVLVLYTVCAVCVSTHRLVTVYRVSKQTFKQRMWLHHNKWMSSGN